MTTRTHNASHGTHRRLAVYAAIAALVGAASINALPAHGTSTSVPAPGPQSTTELVAAFK